MQSWRPVLALLIATAALAGAAPDAAAQSAKVWCYDDNLAYLSRTSPHDCAHRIVDDAEAQRIRAERIRRMQRAVKGEKPLVPGKRLGGSGSGFFISTDGHVLTNHHVVAHCQAVSVWPARGKASVAEVLDTDKAADLALLRAPEAPPAVAVFRGPARLSPGDAVAAVGYPRQLRVRIKPYLAAGLIYFGPVPSPPGRILMKIDIRPGNSGGPVLDESGLVIGVITAELNTPEFYQRTGRLEKDIGLAIDLATVRRFLADHNVAITMAKRGETLDEAHLMARARGFVARIGCWR